MLLHNPINNYNLEVSFDKDKSDPKAVKSLHKSHELLQKNMTKFVSSVLFAGNKTASILNVNFNLFY